VWQSPGRGERSGRGRSSGESGHGVLIDSMVASRTDQRSRISAGVAPTTRTLGIQEPSRRSFETGTVNMLRMSPVTGHHLRTSESTCDLATLRS
jgi:hypothetical protein